MRALVDHRASERRHNNGAHLNVNELDVQVLIDRVQCAHQRDLRRARDNQRGRVMFEAPRARATARVDGGRTSFLSSTAISLPTSVLKKE